MDTPAGKVIAVRRNASGTHVMVEVDASAACPRCVEGKGCGAGLFGGRRTGRHIEAEFASDAAVSSGDLVRLHLAPRSLLQASLIVYGWPLLGALAGASVAYTSSFGDAAAALLALVGMAAGAFLVRRRLRRRDCLRNFTPTAYPAS